MDLTTQLTITAAPSARTEPASLMRATIFVRCQLQGSTILRGEARRMETSCVPDQTNKERTIQYIEICFLCKTKMPIQALTPSEAVRLGIKSLFSKR